MVNHGLFSARSLRYACSFSQVIREIQNTLGRNIIVGNGRSIGVAWTSICISHEAPVHMSTNRAEVAELPNPGNDAVKFPMNPFSSMVGLPFFGFPMEMMGPIRESWCCALVRAMREHMSQRDIEPAYYYPDTPHFME